MAAWPLVFAWVESDNLFKSEAYQMVMNHLLEQISMNIQMALFQTVHYSIFNILYFA